MTSHVPLAISKMLQKALDADLTDLIKEHAQDSFKYLDEAYIKGNAADGKMYAFPVNGNVYAQEFYTFNPTFWRNTTFQTRRYQRTLKMVDLHKPLKNKEPGVAP